MPQRTIYLPEKLEKMIIHKFKSSSFKSLSSYIVSLISRDLAPTHGHTWKEFLLSNQSKLSDDFPDVINELPYDDTESLFSIKKNKK